MHPLLKYPHIPILLLSWMISILLIPLIIRWSQALGALDKPGGHKGHKNPVSFLGGVAVVTAFTVSVLYPKDYSGVDSWQGFMDYMMNPGQRELFGIVFCGLVVFVLGLFDDYIHLNAIFKLAVILACTLILHHFGVVITLFEIGWLNLLITVLWIAGVTSATNSLDHVDGATAGTTAIAAFFTFLFAWYAPEPQRWLSFVSVALLGATLGFLQFNFHPARIYLGDNGAFFLGYVMAAMAMLGGWSQDPVKALITPALITITPVYDIVLSTILRYKNGVVRTFPEAILYCGRDHTTHRMMAHGLSKHVAVYVLYGISAMGGLVALTGQFLGTPGFVAVTLFFFLGLAAFGRWLNECPPEKLKEQ